MKFEVTITDEDFLEFYRYTIKSARTRSGAKSKPRFVLLFLISLVIGVIYSVALKYFDLSFEIFSPTVVVSVFTIVSIFLIFMFQSLKKMQQNALPRKDGVILGSQLLKLDDQGIALEKAGYSTFAKWAKVVSFEESENNYYLYIDTIAAYILPKRVFDSETVQDEFCSLVNNRIETARQSEQAQTGGLEH